jgi:hypothetical protein
MTSEVVQSPNITEDSDPEYTAGLVPSPLGDYSAIQSAFGTPPPITRDNFNNPGADGVFVIFIRTGEESHHEQNVARLFNEMEDQGVPKGRTAVADFTKTPPPRIPDTSELPGSETRDIRQEALRTQLDIFMQFFEPAIQSRLDEGKHSTLIVYFTGHAGGGAYIIDFLNDTTGSWTFNPEDLSVTESKACRIRMIFQNCQAERIQEKMATEFESTEHDVILFAASNRSASAYATPGFMSYIPIVGLLNPITAAPHQ